MQVRNFDLDDAVPPQRDPNTAMMVDIAAVIKLHTLCNRDHSIEEYYTMRDLISRFVPQCTGLLSEYIIRFGSYGIPVVADYVKKCGVSLPDFEQDVDTRCLDFQKQL